MNMQRSGNSIYNTFIAAHTFDTFDTFGKIVAAYTFEKYRLT